MVQVTLTDTNGNPCAGASVNITSDGTDNVFSETLPGTTDDNGAFSVSLTSSALETKQLQITAGAFSSTAQVQFVGAWTQASGSPAHPSLIAVSGDAIATFGGIDDAFVSLDAGVTWTNANAGHFPAGQDLLTPGPNGSFFGFDNKSLIYVLPSPEAQWQLLVPQPTLGANLVNWLRYDPTTHALYADIGFDIQYLPDGGSTWQQSGASGLAFAVGENGDIVGGYEEWSVFGPHAIIPSTYAATEGSPADIIIDDSVSPSVVYVEMSVSAFSCRSTARRRRGRICPPAYRAAQPSSSI